MKCRIAGHTLLKCCIRLTKYQCVAFLLCFSIAILISLIQKRNNLREWPRIPVSHLPRVSFWTPALQAKNPSLTDDRRIFFHETSETGTLNFLQTCCIEAAAMHHSTRPVQLFISGKHTTDTKPWLGVLTKYNNTEIFFLDNYEYFKGTKFEYWYVNGDWKRSPYKLAHLSDYLRINTAERGGGLYMDLDLLTNRPFDEKKFRNFLVYEAASYDMIANTIFHFERGHTLIKEIINVMISEYDPNEYIFHGPEAFTAAMYYRCRLNRGSPETNECENVKLFSYGLINPINSFFSNLYYTDAGLEEEWISKVNKSYATHLFSSIDHKHLRKNLLSQVRSDHLIGRLARKNCPWSVMEVSRFK